jgi:hypothetical protein
MGSNTDKFNKITKKRLNFKVCIFLSVQIAQQCQLNTENLRALTKCSLYVFQKGLAPLKQDQPRVAVRATSWQGSWS